MITIRRDQWLDKAHGAATGADKRKASFAHELSKLIEKSAMATAKRLGLVSRFFGQKTTVLQPRFCKREPDPLGAFEIVHRKTMITLFEKM